MRSAIDGRQLAGVGEKPLQSTELIWRQFDLCRAVPCAARDDGNDQVLARARPLGVEEVLLAVLKFNGLAIVLGHSETL